MKLNAELFTWTRKPAECEVHEDYVRIVTEPNTDLWQRTYYGFRKDTAPVFQMTTKEEFFTFSVKTEFDYKNRVDQCGVVVYLDSENWLKASVEYGKTAQFLGSVVTNHGFSDWAMTEISPEVSSLWYRLSRRGADYRVEYSEDGVTYHPMRICHLQEGGGEIHFGIYACSPDNSSFEACFTELELTDCVWAARK